MHSSSIGQQHVYEDYLLISILSCGCCVQAPPTTWGIDTAYSAVCAPGPGGSLKEKALALLWVSTCKHSLTFNTLRHVVLSSLACNNEYIQYCTIVTTDPNFLQHKLALRTQQNITYTHECVCMYISYMYIATHIIYFTDNITHACVCYTVQWPLYVHISMHHPSSNSSFKFGM